MTEKNNTEMYFEWWLDELKENGLVLSYVREPKSYVLNEPVVIFYNQNKVRSSFMKSFELYPALTYTFDYTVVFSKKLINVLIGEINMKEQTIVDNDFKDVGSVYQNTLFYTAEFDDQGNPIVHFDVKPPTLAVARSGQLGSSRDFKYVSRLLFERYGMITNKVVPTGMKTSLFGKTFMPKRFRFTDKSLAVRKLKDYEQKFKNFQQYAELKNLK